jgi:hypothetical protein
MTHVSAPHYRKSLRTAVAGCLALCAMAICSPAEANMVVTDVGACADYYVVAAPSGYALVQWLAGASIGKSDTLAGDINSTGIRDVALLRGGMVRLLADNFGMNYASATYLLRTQCGVRGPLAFP